MTAHNADDVEVAARALTDTADDLAIWMHEHNFPDDVILAVCTWVRLRARAADLGET